MSPLELDFEDETPNELPYTICEHEQGSEEWHLDRLGIPTASSFDKIITTTGKPSTSSTTYMNQLLADWFAGYPVDPWAGNVHTENGNEREPQARELYSFINDVVVEQIGFCRLKRIDVGCSPDGMVNDNAVVEFKCPKGATLIGYLLKNELPTSYFQQVHGQLWILEREHADFFAWHPDIGHFQKRVHRDDKFIAALEREVVKFNDIMFEMRHKLKSQPVEH